MVKKMFGKSKNAFWEAFLLAVVIFSAGLLLGIAYEGTRLDDINEYYARSEIGLMDLFALNNLVEVNNVSCSVLVEANLNFADRIYNEAILLSEIEESGKVGNDIWLAHRKYDTLRTLLWINSMKTYENCGTDFSLVVYLYEYHQEDLVKKAMQGVWSKILADLKQEKGSEIILIPIAVDSELISLDSSLSKFDIQSYPVVIINNRVVLNEVSSVEDIEKYLD